VVVVTARYVTVPSGTARVEPLRLLIVATLVLSVSTGSFAPSGRVLVARRRARPSRTIVSGSGLRLEMPSFSLYEYISMGCFV
jgi:hypothetical protein